MQVQIIYLIKFKYLYWVNYANYLVRSCDLINNNNQIFFVDNK